MLGSLGFRRLAILFFAATIAVLNVEVNGHTWKEILLSIAIVGIAGASTAKLKLAGKKDQEPPC